MRLKYGGWLLFMAAHGSYTAGRPDLAPPYFHTTGSSVQCTRSPLKIQRHDGMGNLATVYYVLYYVLYFGRYLFNKVFLALFSEVLPNMAMWLYLSL